MPQDLTTLGTAPIAGASPAGASARYEPEFDKLAAEIAKMESVDGASSIKWKDVVELASDLLSAKSKDLLVASYLTLGLLKQEGYAGLTAGLGIVRDLLKTFWDGLFPEKNRLKARANALVWLGERAAADLTERAAGDSSERETIQAAVATLEEIETLCREKFEGMEPPEMGPLSRAIVDKMPPDEPPPSEEPPPQEAAPAEGEAPAEEAPPQEEAAPVEAAPAAIDSPEAAREAIGGIRERLFQAAAILREAGPTDPLPYRLSRTAAWCDLVEAPAANAGVTEQAGGDAGFSAEQEKRLEKGDYLPVVVDCEARVATDPLWLDLNFFEVRAMEGLGRPYASARKVVADEVARLARAVPALLDLKFADGTPMAAEATRVWILHELKAIPTEGSPTNGVHPAEAALQEARKLVARKQFAEATSKLQKVVQAATHRRERFVCRLNLAKLCLDAGKPELARPQLEALDRESKEFPLEEWEPALVVELAKDLWRCYSASSAPEKAEEAYSRLSRLDLSAALALGKKG